MDGRVDETVHVIFFCRFDNTQANKKYKERKLSEIIIAICAMLNSNGGNVVLHNECDCEKCKSSRMSLVVRILEQSIMSIIGSNKTVSNINIRDKESIVISVKKSDCLITHNYNLCLPSQSLVVQVSPLEPLENVKRDIINRKVVEEPVQLGSHCKLFVKDSTFGQRESKTVQFKHVKADPSKCTRLADRMTGKGNKFSCYVSAFANYSGGHIYYGIRDDGVVEGELISNEQDKNEITKKVRKVVNKMIWPEEIGQPKRGVHWEIFFEAVVDENSKLIPSTFVIVIYIAACVGGVFTVEPECYEMVEGKVEKMSFATWKERILGLKPVESVPYAISSSITWVSKTTRNLCIKAFCVLTLFLNNVDLEGYEKSKKYFVEQYPDIVELELVVLLKEILARARRHNFKKADDMLERYNKLLQNATEKRIFEVLGYYVEAAYNRPKEVERKEVERKAINRIRDLLVFAMAKSHWLIPGLVTAVVYLLAGTMTDRFDDTFLDHSKPDELSYRALQHLQIIPDYPEVRDDLQNKAHITLATYYLGCNISGKLVAEHVNDNCLKKANSSIRAIDRDNRKLTHYREVQLNLVKSIYSFRCSENQPEERMHFMREAYEYSEDSEKLARKWKFYEMVSWNKSLQSLYVEKLLRATLAQKRMHVHKSSTV